jgi:hypothetical protein
MAKKVSNSTTTKTERDISAVPPALQTEAVALFDLNIDRRGREDVVNYLAGQASDEVVKHAEKIKSENINGMKYDVWDVITDKNRWWVISNMMNLYSQSLFPSLDYTLSFHIGLMARMIGRQENKAQIHNSFVSAWRKFDQASIACDNASEPEDYQAVGMRCREALVAFVKDEAKTRIVGSTIELPKSGDFKGWTEILLNEWVPGQSLKELRSYLKNSAISVWQLVSWITHASNATHYEAYLAVNATENILSSLSIAHRKFTDGVPNKCEICGSYQISTHFVVEEMAYQPFCPACGWEGDYLLADD